MIKSQPLLSSLERQGIWQKKIISCIFQSFLEGWMPDDFELLSLGRTEHTQEDFRNYILENIKAFSRNKNFSEDQWNAFKEKSNS
jgi:glucose-6-phosphate 1-dehydrogenase